MSKKHLKILAFVLGAIVVAFGLICLIAGLKAGAEEISFGEALGELFGAVTESAGEIVEEGGEVIEGATETASALVG